MDGDGNGLFKSAVGCTSTHWLYLPPLPFLLRSLSLGVNKLRNEQFEMHRVRILADPIYIVSNQEVYEIESSIIPS